LIGLTYRTYEFLEKVVKELSLIFGEVKGVILKNSYNFYENVNNSLKKIGEIIHKSVDSPDKPPQNIDLKELSGVENYQLSLPNSFSNVIILAVNGTTFVVPSIAQYPDLRNVSPIVLPSEDSFQSYSLDDYGFIYDFVSATSQPITKPGIPIASSDWCITKIWNLSVTMAFLKDLLNLILSYCLISKDQAVISDNKDDENSGNKKNKTIVMKLLTANLHNDFNP
jgi:hypothetical protein